MKLYLVRGYDCIEDEEFITLYGVFSTIDKAIEIQNKLQKVVDNHCMGDEIRIEEIILDEPTEVYHYMMSI